MRLTGKVKSLFTDKSFGFIRVDNQDYFFHRDDIVSGDFDDIQRGQEVTFEPREGKRGLRASNVEC